MSGLSKSVVISNALDKELLKQIKARRKEKEGFTFWQAIKLIFCLLGFLVLTVSIF